MNEEISPLAPPAPQEPPAIRALRLQTFAGSLRYKGRDDLFVASCENDATVAGVFTQSQCPSAAVDYSKAQLTKNTMAGTGFRAILCNAGNANAYTGEVGLVSAEKQAEAVGLGLAVNPSQVLLASTGVIGEPIDDQAMQQAIAGLMQSDPVGFIRSANAIRTTDTFAKVAAVTVKMHNSSQDHRKSTSLQIEEATESVAAGQAAVSGGLESPAGPVQSGQAATGGQSYSIVGIAKGSGMIAPNMATMLGFIFTDRAVEQGFAQQALARVVAETFNRVTVDSDTSTSDTVFLMSTNALGKEAALSANGELVADAALSSRGQNVHNKNLASGVLAESSQSGARGNCQEHSQNLEAVEFIKALHEVCDQLARQITCDGEGATKFIEVSVTGAKSDQEADRVARSIANSPLVKTAIGAGDANWGRVVMAIGKADAEVERDRFTISFSSPSCESPVLVACNGAVASSYSESQAAAVLANSHVEILVDLGLGEGKAQVWGNDLTKRYVEINADYRS